MCDDGVARMITTQKQTDGRRETSGDNDNGGDKRWKGKKTKGTKTRDGRTVKGEEGGKEGSVSYHLRLLALFQRLLLLFSASVLATGLRKRKGEGGKEMRLILAPQGDKRWLVLKLDPPPPPEGFLKGYS